MSHKSLLVVVTLVLALAIQWAVAQTDCIGTPGSSSRACLVAIAERYFAALAAHDPSKAPMAATVRFTERPEKGTGSSPLGALPLSNSRVTDKNDLSLTVGDGLWKTIAEGPTAFKIYVPDPVSQEIGGIAMIKSEDQPTAFAFRLKVQNGRITEADHILVPIRNAAALTNLKTPRPELLAAVPPAERLDRETLRSLAYTSYDAKTQSAHALPCRSPLIACVRKMVCGRHPADRD
jgi:hypothetical protein